MSDLVQLFRDALIADHACIAAVRSVHEHRELTGNESRMIDLMEQRIALLTRDLITALEAEE